MFKFQSRAGAWEFALKGRKNAVILGDDERFWVVTCAEAQRLERQGYSVEYLPR